MNIKSYSLKKEFFAVIAVSIVSLIAINITAFLLLEKKSINKDALQRLESGISIFYKELDRFVVTGSRLVSVVNEKEDIIQHLLIIDANTVKGNFNSNDVYKDKIYDSLIKINKNLFNQTGGTVIYDQSGKIAAHIKGADIEPNSLYKKGEYFTEKNESEIKFYKEFLVSIKDLSRCKDKKISLKSVHGISVLCIGEPIFKKRADGKQIIIGYITNYMLLNKSFADKFFKETGIGFYYYINGLEASYIKSFLKNDIIYESSGKSLKMASVSYELDKLKPVYFPKNRVDVSDINKVDSSYILRQFWNFDNVSLDILFFYKSNYASTFSNIEWSVILIAVISLFILGPAIYLWLNRTIYNPLDKIVNQVSRIKDGNYREEEVVSLGNEFSILSNDINKMAKIIYERESQLKIINEELNKLVDKEINKRMKNEKLLMDQKKFADMGQMIAAIAHQWRQPLNVLSLLIQQVLMDVREGTIAEQDIDEFEKHSIDTIRFMSRTIEDFRKFLSPSKKAELFNPSEVVSDVIKLVTPQLNSNKIECISKCMCGISKNIDLYDFEVVQCGNKKAVVYGMPGELKQAILNIINNAKDAILENISKTQAEGKILIEINVDSDYITINTLDNGGGIPENIKNKIYDPYFTTKEEGKGTGLGLYMTKLIIEETMKGKIEVENIQNGTSFKIILPLYKGDE